MAFNVTAHSFDPTLAGSVEVETHNTGMRKEADRLAKELGKSHDWVEVRAADGETIATVKNGKFFSW